MGRSHDDIDPGRQNKRPLSEEPWFPFAGLAIEAIPRGDRDALYEVTQGIMLRVFHEHDYAWKTALFLAVLSFTPTQKLQSAVKRGLELVGIPRYRRKRGRRRGRSADQNKLQIINMVMKVFVEEVWRRKEQLRKQYPRNWQPRLRRDLEGRWPPEHIDAAVTAHTPDSLAIRIAELMGDRPSSAFPELRKRVTYDSWARSLTRAKKSDQK